MLELRVKVHESQQEIALIENGNLVEYYQEKEELYRKEGNIYLGVIKDIVPGMQSAFVDIGTEKNSFIHLKDILPKVDETVTKINDTIKITDVVKQNQKVLVQVKKDSNEKKGARVSTHINLPSKYIVLMPNSDIVTISQKIDNPEEHKRLIELVKNNLSKENGAVIRTSAVNKEKEIIDDIKRLEKRWNQILQKSKELENKNKPVMVYQSETIVEKMLIDLSEKSVEKIIVNDKKEQEKIEKFRQENAELISCKIEYEGEEDLFLAYDVNKQIEKMKNRKIWLKCGGFITIDPTEALTAIDVNTGKYTGTKNLEQTIYKVNEEATIEIAKQLRLRDIGGIIIIDYIDMKKEENKLKIQNLLLEKLKKDRSKTQVEGFTKLDLMELTRKHICSHNEEIS